MQVNVPCVEIIPKKCARGLMTANCVYCKYFVEYKEEEGVIVCQAPDTILDTADYD